MIAMDIIESLHPIPPADSAARRAAMALVDLLLDEESVVKTHVCEATVHVPHSGRIWNAVFTGPNGGQVWKSTGMTDKEQALLLAKRWEVEAREERAKLGRLVRKPTWRVRNRSPRRRGWPAHPKRGRAGAKNV